MQAIPERGPRPGQTPWSLRLSPVPKPAPRKTQNLLVFNSETPSAVFCLFSPPVLPVPQMSPAPRCRARPHSISLHLSPPATNHASFLPPRLAEHHGLAKTITCSRTTHQHQATADLVTSSPTGKDPRRNKKEAKRAKEKKPPSTSSSPSSQVLLHRQRRPVGTISFNRPKPRLALSHFFSTHVSSAQKSTSPLPVPLEERQT
ncbi:hypothetical protein B0J13DRAFT_545380 [Dactylonectria estremocensis]|uniref:Uncharacterized protein n=1 Tax=Dactylonectria estremocensis TaxID=1079267 RepID=A0A9P9F6X8_9HYPO|nr:hypothetical protein B0J13DRAFT_545380 [Dactylonectria estremocensis]